MSPPNIPYIISNNAYRFKPTISEATIPPFNLPSYWLKKAHGEFPSLSEHTSDNTATARMWGVYSGRADLVQSFSFFYAILTDRVTLPGITITEGMKQSMREKILEGIQNCSPGFHNRINSLYGSFFIPKTVYELLQKVRQSILQEIVSQESDDVHRQNFVSQRAQADGYGTECINSKDIYSSNDRRLRQNPESLLYYGFIQRYTWLNITKKLQEELKSVLIGTFAYRGCLEGQEEGYDKGEYTGFIKYLNELFSTEYSEQEWLIFDDDYLTHVTHAVLQSIEK